MQYYHVFMALALVRMCREHLLDVVKLRRSVRRIIESKYAGQVKFIQVLVFRESTESQQRMFGLYPVYHTKNQRSMSHVSVCNFH